jgi:hypothetical protein
MIHLLDPSEHSSIRVIQGRRKGLEYLFHVLGLVGVKTLQLLQLAIRPTEPIQNVKISIIAEVGIEWALFLHAIRLRCNGAFNQGAHVWAEFTKTPIT